MSGVVAKVLGDLNWAGNRETPMVLSVLVFEERPAFHRQCYERPQRGRE